MSKMNLREIVIDSLGKVKAKDVLIYDMKGFSPFFDEMVLATSLVMPSTRSSCNDTILYVIFLSPKLREGMNRKSKY